MVPLACLTDAQLSLADGAAVAVVGASALEQRQDGAGAGLEIVFPDPGVKKDSHLRPTQVARREFAIDPFGTLPETQLELAISVLISVLHPPRLAWKRFWAMEALQHRAIFRAQQVE